MLAALLRGEGERTTAAVTGAAIPVDGGFAL
jgi:hypothetical protein